MTGVPSYCKVAALGAVGTMELLQHPVIVQEKVDGSQFAFGMDIDGTPVCRSHNRQITEGDDLGMFREAVEHALQVIPLLSPGEYAYCEYLQKPKQNTLCYARTPRHNLVLFDVITGEPGALDGWATRAQLEVLAGILEIDLVPELYAGVADVPMLQGLLATDSFLGGVKVEGIVIKDYSNQAYKGGTHYPAMAKLVRQDFRERNAKEWRDNSPKGRLETYLESFRTEARWKKVVQHLAEDGQLEYAPRDIAKLMRGIHTDLEDEEMENIARDLAKMYFKDIVREAQRGAAEWYKDWLLKRLERGVGEDK